MNMERGEWVQVIMQKQYAKYVGIPSKRKRNVMDEQSDCNMSGGKIRQD